MNKAYKKNGIRIREAFDKDALWLSSAFDNYTDEYPFVDIIPDDSTGTDSGYDLTSERGITYVLRTMVDLSNDGYSLQSFCYNYNDGNYYRFDASTTVVVYDSFFNQLRTITTPSSIGHGNDACYYNGSFYLPNTHSVIEWSPTENTVETMPINGIVQPTNGSERTCDALCLIERTLEEIFLICRDKRSGDISHQDGDMMSVYRYNLETHDATLMYETPWDCVYIQGAAYYKGILYVACNTQTTGSASNYKGITVKVIRTDIWSLIDELICEGVFEPEGMDVVSTGEGQEIEMGIGHYTGLRLITRFTAPYATIECN